MLGLGAVPGVALAVGMILMPHSPRWLMERGRDDEARAVLERVHRRGEDIDGEMDDIRRVVAEEGSLRDIIGAKVRPMLIVGLALAIFQQIVGINTVIYYAPTILTLHRQQRLERDHPDRLHRPDQRCLHGRRGAPARPVRPAGVPARRHGRADRLPAGARRCSSPRPALRHAVPDLALIALIVYIASFAIGLGPVFWLMISEIFPLHLRSPAMALCTVANWAFNFLVSFTFLSLVGALGRTGTFLLYAAVGVIALIFFATRVPETNGRSLEEIEQQLRRKRRPRAAAVEFRKLARQPEATGT